MLSLWFDRVRTPRAPSVDQACPPPPYPPVRCTPREVDHARQEACRSTRLTPPSLRSRGLHIEKRGGSAC